VTLGWGVLLLLVRDETKMLVLLVVVT